MYAFGVVSPRLVHLLHIIPTVAIEERLQVDIGSKYSGILPAHIAANPRQTGAHVHTTQGPTTQTCQISAAKLVHVRDLVFIISSLSKVLNCLFVLFSFKSDRNSPVDI